MNYQDFLQEIKLTIAKNIDSTCTVDIEKIYRNNGTTLDGLIIHDPSINIAPTIYLNPYYHRYLNGQTMHDIYNDIISTYNSVIPKCNFDTDNFLKFESIKDKIIMKLVNYEKNEELLKKLPHIKVFDLAIIFQVLVSSIDNTSGTIIIYNSYLDFWNVDANEIYTYAKANSPMLLPVAVMNVSSLFNIPAISNEIPMYIITNNAHINGAIGILYENVLKKLSEKLNSDLILIPSSVHEFLAFPNYTHTDLSECNKMVYEVNSTAVADEAVLSNHVYLYSRVNNSVSSSDDSNMQFIIN